MAVLSCTRHESLASIRVWSDRTAFVKGGFEKTRTELVERPWAIDNLDQVLQRWQQKPHHKAMLFVDNAGTDVVLGEQQHATLSVCSSTCL
jgi:hypothetical protein